MLTDAGATTLKIIYDRRRHLGSFGDDKTMQVALEPSLLFANDQIFTDADFERIQHIGDGGKVRDSKRTGRFGLGFNTCYSVSDNPSLLTQDKIAWFDPHHRIAPIKSKGKNAIAWKLKSAKEAWPHWITTFGPAGLKPSDLFFEGTIFRLPLRSDGDAELSEISQEPFNDEDFEAILKELEQIGPPIILFLRSVTSLEVREIDPDGTDNLRYWICTVNQSEVDRQRSILREIVDGTPEVLIERWLKSDEQLPVLQYDHELIIKGIDNTEREEIWAVVTGLFRGENNSLLEHASKVCKHKEKAIPWAGAATLRTGPKAQKKGISGGLACFLPLPEPVSWPIWIHGWFDLSSNRRGISRSAEVGENTHDRFEWNKSLMKFGVAKAWLRLLEQIAGNAEENETPYLLWPRYPNSPDDIDKSLLTGFYREAAVTHLIRGRHANGFQWRCLNDGVYDLPKKWHDKLLDPLLAEGWSICAPSLEKFLQEGFEKSGKKLPDITAKFVREHLDREYLDADGMDVDIACPLAEAPNSMLTKREWVTALTEFCAENDLDNLKFLPLALLGDGLLHTFTACGTIFIIEEEHRILMEPLPEHLVDREYQAVLSGISDSSKGINLVKFDLSSFIEFVPEILSKGKPSNSWLGAFFDYLEKQSEDEIENCRSALNKLEIVPDQFGNWHKMGLIYTPLILTRNKSGSQKTANETLFKALTQLNIPLLYDKAAELIEKINLFSIKHDGFIWHLTPNDVADNLKYHAEEPTLDELAFDDMRGVLQPLLNFLTSEEDWLKSGDARLPSLRKLRILPTTCGQRVAAEEPNVYIPGSFSPPPGFEGKYRLLDSGIGNKWEKFFSVLGVRTLDGAAFVEDALLPAFSSATHEQRYSLLVWLRDEFRLVERELNEQTREKLRKKIRYTPILPIKGGGMAAFSAVYHPKSDEPLKLFGDRARIPDMNFFTRDKDLWLEFFHEFGLLWKPLVKDLIKEIQVLVDVSFDHGASAVRVPLRNLINYIREHWADVAYIEYEGKTTFAETLSQLSWLLATPGEEANYAAYATWQDCLWRADQIVPSRLANLVASKYPVLDTKIQEFPDGMSKFLGLVTRVTLPDVLEHFTNVQASLSTRTSEKELEMIRRTAQEVYRFIGQINSTEKAQWQVQLNSLTEEACVLAENKWWKPSRCFFSKLSFTTPWAVSLAGIFSSTDSSLRQGLEQLGVRQAPDNDDWLEILWDLSKEADYDVLNSDALNQARHIMRLLRSAPNEWFENESILIPLYSGKLEKASLSLIPDDPRLNKMGCANPIPLIEDNEDAIDVGRRAGAHSFRSCLVDRLKEKPVATGDQTFAQRLQERVRSSDFQGCLRRIAYEESLRQNNSDPLESANDQRLDRVRMLEICIASKIEIESIVEIDGKDVVAFEVNDAACFLDKDTPRLWLKERGVRKMRDEVVRAFGDLCGLKEQLWLDRILEREPSEMSKVLDEGDVANIPEGKKIELGDGYEIPSEVDQEDYKSMDSVEDNEDSLTDEYFNEGFADIEEIEDGDSSITKEVESPSITGTNNHQFEHGNLPPRSTGHKSSGGKSSGGKGLNVGNSGQKSSEPKSPPTQPGHGSSNPWAGESKHDSNKTSQTRLRSYVHESEQSDYDNNVTELEAKEIGDAGESIVMQWEKKSGRIPRRMPQNNEGYDIESEGKDGIRYIEVKSVKGTWGLRGVGVTKPQYKAAQEKGQSWWLYIVENATGSHPKVTPIQNPFYYISEYRFDDGWRVVGENKIDEISIVQKPEIGAQYLDDRGFTITIVEAKKQGTFWGIKIKVSDGTIKKSVWNPKWLKV